LQNLEGYRRDELELREKSREKKKRRKEEEHRNFNDHIV